MAISIHAPRGGSDITIRRRQTGNTYFNPRSPWGERPRIHLPILHRCHFNPRSPWGERRAGRGHCRQAYSISIHAPRGGSDPGNKYDRSGHSNFNPRSPWGERLLYGCGVFVGIQFQSTLPVGGATRLRQHHAVVAVISIHAPRGGSDGYYRLLYPGKLHFNPRSPWGERPVSPGKSG